jgi:threonine synthase
LIRYRCASCGYSFESEQIEYRCSKCAGVPEDFQGFQKGNLLIEIEEDRLKAELRPGDRIDPFALLPRDFPIADCHGKFPAGNTPVAAIHGLGQEGEFKQIWGKMDNLNPSGSLKDRASLLVAAQALLYNERKVVLASTGNAGSAMSCAGAALGLDIILFVPAAAPMEKLAQSVFYGARVIPVEGTYDDAFALSIEFSRERGGINRNTAYNPLTIEGKKTTALEIYNQFKGKLPDLIYVPVGDGVILTGLYKGFEDLLKLGLIERIPRCIAVQARGSNAISRSLREDRDVLLEKSETLADSISVASPACGSLALEYLRRTQSWSVELEEKEILEAQGELARKGGVFVEPSSAVSWGAVKRDKQEGRITGEESILLLLTGSGFKDMKAVTQGITLPEPVEPRLEVVLEYLES